MALIDTTDIVILAAIGVATAGFIYWRSISSASTEGPSKVQSSGSKPIIPKKSSKKSIIQTLSEIENPNKLILFYGSQTGTAEDLASRVAKEAASHFGVHSIVADLEEYDMSELTKFPEPSEDSKWLTGFFLATYGEGEPTDNAIEFYDWFMNGRGRGDDDDVEEEDEMTEEQAGKNLRYIMFGLGNKTYEHFNAMSRRVNRRMKAIGATRVGPSGEGDDDASMEDDFLAWKPKLFEALAEYYGVKDTGGKANRDAPHVPLFQMQPASAETAETFYGELSGDNKPRRFKPSEDVEGKFTEVSTKRRIIYDAKNPHFGRIVNSRHLFGKTHDSFIVNPSEVSPSPRYKVEDDKVFMDRHCIHMELDISGSGLRYESGDHVGVYAANEELEVQGLADALKLSKEELDDVVVLKPNSANPQASTAKIPFPNPCSVRTALSHYLAIKSTMKQHQLEILAKYATSETEKALLFELVDDRDKYVKLIENSQKTLREILQAFPSISVPLNVVLGEVLPRIAVRYYSISSSSKKDPSVVSLTAVVVRYVLPSPNPQNIHQTEFTYKEGLATSWIYRLHEQRLNGGKPSITESDVIPTPPLHVPMFIRTSSFRLPRDPAVPVVMVGPGTGVAPFRGFVHERVHVASTRPPGAKPVGSTWLFYGCRHPDQDYLYREEFEGCSKVVESWRSEEGGNKAFDLQFFNAFSRYEGKKVYVQHLLAEKGKEVWELLDAKRGYFYVCGDAKHMAADVHQALLRMAMDIGGKSEEKAKSWIKDLRTSSRYQEDVW
ncbi:NADPH-cytochrome P450 reductase [Blyttiomyces sp. JEL0837]|nr:NADPH-cytochrome P450 reductase [Blyttiomyces sp. JEL0837]